MFEPLIYVEIDGVGVELDSIKEFEITADINRLPEGKLVLMDSGGFKTSRFAFTIGSQVNFSFIEKSSLSKEKDPKKLNIEYYSLIVTNIVNSVTELPFLGGVVTLTLNHPLMYYRDYTDHAYSAMPISELIRKVIENNARGWQIEVDAANFEISRDSGKQCRYKCGISDYDFIMEQLLPFAESRQHKTGLYFFIDEFGVPYLQSFNEMFKETEKAILSTINETSKQDEIVKPQKIVPVGSAQIAIGLAPDGSNLQRRIKAWLYAEDLRTRHFQVGKMVPNNKISKESGKVSGNRIPFVLATVEQMPAHDCRIMMNRTTEEQYSLLATNRKALNSMFLMGVSTGWCGDEVTVGNTVHFVSGRPKFENEKKEGKIKAKMSWTNGKWLVSSMKHYATSVRPDGARQKLTPYTQMELIRPTFVINEKDTSVFAPELLYTIDS